MKATLSMQQLCKPAWRAVGSSPSGAAFVAISAGSLLLRAREEIVKLSKETGRGAVHSAARENKGSI